MPWGLVAAAAGGALGLGKTIAGRRAANRQNEARRQEMRYSPFTGNKPREFTQKPGFLGGVAGGALQGFNIYKGINKMGQDKELFDLKKQSIESNIGAANAYRDALLNGGGANNGGYFGNNNINPYAFQNQFFQPKF